MSLQLAGGLPVLVVPPAAIPAVAVADSLVWASADFPVDVAVDVLAGLQGVLDADVVADFAPPPSLHHLRTRQARIPVWGLHKYRLKSVRQLVTNALGAALALHVRRIVAVSQDDGTRRHDVFVSRSRVNTVLATLRSVKRQYRWHCKLAIPWRRPSDRPNDMPWSFMSDVCEQKRAKLMTWNMWGIGKRKEVLEVFLRRSEITVCALQETLRKVEHGPLQVCGYSVIERHLKPGTGKRGVALLFAGGIQHVEVGRADSPYFIFARASGGPLPCGVVFGSVYIPVSGIARKEAMSALKTELVALRLQFPQCPLVIFGDWNLERQVLCKWLESVGCGVVIKEGRGSMLSRHRKHVPLSSAIDHIVVSAEHVSLLGMAWVDRSLYSSDHWPIRSAFRRLDAPVVVGVGMDNDDSVSEVPWVFRRASKWQDSLDAVLGQKQSSQNCVKVATFATSHNRFSALEDFCTTMEDNQDNGVCVDVDQMASALKVVSNEVAVSAGIRVLKCPVRRTLNVYPRARMVRAIEAARTAFQEWCTSCDDGSSPAEVSRLGERHDRLDKESKRVVSRCRKAQWCGFLTRGIEQAGSDSGALWAFSKQISGHGSRHKVLPSSIRPVWDPALPNQLLTDAGAVKRAMREHFCNQSVDPNVRASAHWTGVAGAPVAPLQDLMSCLEWPLVVEALGKLKRGTSSGSDGIPPEWFKLVADGISSSGDGSAAIPSSPMGKAVFSILHAVFATGCIPEEWQESVVVPIDKSGDVKSLGNLRGISLLQTSLKVLCTAVSINLCKVAESNNLLRREQGGFRQNEECLGQVVALHEILVRRRAAGTRSYVAFVDLKSAFDMVPHEALFARLAHVGIGGPVLQFIKGLYRSSSMRLRFPDGSLSEPYALQRGVRQGCPLSSILFNIYIDTMFDNWVDAAGVSVAVQVPGSDKKFPLKIPGLLFADDGVVLADSPAALIAILLLVSQWCDRWHMSANASKCAIMLVPLQSSNAEYQDFKTAVCNRFLAGFVIQGAPVPVVEKTTYLGCVLHYSLDLLVTATDRAEKGLRSIMAQLPFLRNPTIPLRIRVMVFRGTVMRTCLYGAELWGGVRVHADIVQKAVNKGLRLLLGCGLDSKLPAMFAVYRELEIPPVAVSALQARLRAFDKYRGLKTWVSTLITCPPYVGVRPGSWVWSSATIVANRDAKRRAVPGPNGSITLESPHAMMIRVTDSYWRSLEGSNTAATLDRYRLGQFASSSLHRPSFQWLPAVGVSLGHLLRARVGAFATDARLLHFPNSAAAQNQGMCRFCAENALDTVAHVLVQCSRWDTVRKHTLFAHLRAGVQLLCANVPPLSPSSANLATLLLGGAVCGARLSRWSQLDSPLDDINDAASVVSDDLSIVHSCADSVPGDANRRPFLFQSVCSYAVAYFLQTVAVERRLLDAGVLVAPAP
jgi:exonuclease III